MKNNIKFVTIILVLCNSFFLESASIGRYEFTERLANCSVFNQNQVASGNSIGASASGIVDDASMSNFVSCFDQSPSNQIDSLNMYSLTTSTGCIAEKVTSPSGCVFELTPINTGNSIAISNSGYGFSGFTIYTCSSIGNWNLQEEFCTPISEAPCLSELHSWTNSGGTCEANISRMYSGETIQVSNIVPELNGYTSVSCSDGAIIGGTGFCNYGCDSLDGEAVSWTVNDKVCNGILELTSSSGENTYTSEAKNGDIQYIDDQSKETNFVYGNSNFTCVNNKLKPISATCEKVSTSIASGPLVSCQEVKVESKSSSGVIREQYRHRRCNWNL
jgi:hypothetical protein